MGHRLGLVSLRVEAFDRPVGLKPVLKAHAVLLKRLVLLSFLDGPHHELVFELAFEGLSASHCEGYC